MDSAFSFTFVRAWRTTHQQLSCDVWGFPTERLRTMCKKAGC